MADIIWVTLILHVSIHGKFTSEIIQSSMRKPQFIGFLRLLFLHLTVGWCLLTTPFSLTAQDSEKIHLVGHWFSTRPETNNREARYNDVWAFERDGEEFAAIGSTIGTHIVHLPRTGALREVAFIPGGASGSYVVHRDFATFGDYLYGVCDQQPSALQVIDLRALPDTAYLTLATDAFFSTAHNITADECSGKLYVSGSSGHAMTILDAAGDPANPVLLRHFDLVDYVHDVYVRCDTAFLSAALEGLFVFNFSDVENPQLLGTLQDYPDRGYCHSGWLNEDASIYVMADETPGTRLKVCNVTDLANIEVLSLLSSEGASHTMPHNVVVHNNTVYVAYYFDGLQVFDIANPEQPHRKAWYRTYNGVEEDYRGAWGVHAGLPSGRVLISDRQGGLFVFHEVAGNSSFNEEDFVIFPNPGGRDAAVLVRRSNFIRMTCNVFGLNGRMVSTGTYLGRGDSFWVPLGLEQVSEGMYLVELIVDEGAPVVLRYIVR